MWNFDYTKVSEIQSFLNNNGLAMTKKFGQNFLISDSALDKIVQAAGIEKNVSVWEIGPGLGALTSKMLKAGAIVTAFEIDHGFCSILKEQAFADTPSFRLVEGDALKTWKEEYKANGKPDLICANLPYNVGSVLIASFIENRMLPDKMVFTLQSEVVQRICSDIGDDEYSGFSILTNIDYENKEVLKLKPSNFWPAPNVDSSVVVMTKRKGPSVEENIAPEVIKLVRVLFAQRRKTVRNNLKVLGLGMEKINSALENAGIPETERAEKLTLKQISDLARNLI